MIQSLRIYKLSANKSTHSVLRSKKCTQLISYRKLARFVSVGKWW